MNIKKASMRDIAHKLNISVVSVSKAINNQSGVSDDLRQKILDEAFRIGYISLRREPSALSKKLAYVTSKRFAFEGEVFFTQIFYYLNELCNAKEIALSLFTVNKDDEGKLGIPAVINAGNFDGVFVGGEISELYVHSLQNLDLPVVCIDFYKSDVDVDYIIMDNFYASYSATMYLIKSGHSRIGYVRNPISDASYLDRFFGCQKALFQQKLEFRPDWRLISTDSLELPAEMPTAFVCDNDTIAISLMKVLSKNNYAVPEDVSVIGFDDIETSKNQKPPLTTVEISRSLFAEKAFERMMNRISDRSAPFQRVLLDTKLIVRESVKNISK